MTILIEIMSAGELPVTTRNIPFNKGGGGGMIICNIYLYLCIYFETEMCIPEHQNILFTHM